MWHDKWVRIGALGSAVSALCCFTPLLAGLMGVFGLMASAVWIDVIVLPVLVISVGIFAAAMIRVRQSS